jgi:hypothetical protein
MKSTISTDGSIFRAWDIRAIIRVREGETKVLFRDNSDVRIMIGLSDHNRLVEQWASCVQEESPQSVVVPYG